MSVSENGYRANDRSLIETRTIPGTERKASLRKGAPGDLLIHFAAWFDKNIESIDHDGQLDDWTYAERNVRGSNSVVSNHASGTAIDLNATKHPLGKRGTFTPGQARRIREQLKVYCGCIRWGGDFQRRADEMHFEINASPDTCATTLRNLTSGRPVQEPKPAKVTNHVTEGRRLIREGRASIRAGVAELRKAKTKDGKERPAVQTMADTYAAKEAAMSGVKGPTS